MGNRGATPLLEVAHTFRPRIVAERDDIEAGRRLPEDLTRALARAGSFGSKLRGPHPGWPLVPHSPPTGDGRRHGHGETDITEQKQAERDLVEATRRTEEANKLITEKNRILEDLYHEIRDKNQQLEEQAAQIADWNSRLETRAAEQVAQIGQMSKLTRFLSPKVSDLIMSGDADDPLKTRRREITVVFVDLRGFTGFTETAEPEEVMSVLREYHAALGRAIMAHDGTIEHFAGDGVMILFNDPVPVENHELQAIHMSLLMRDSVAGLARGWKKRGYALGFGVGIAGGYATIGTIGFEGRLDYGAIGTVTNLAARVCGEANDGQILISPRIYSKVEAHIEAEPVRDLSLKGFHRPVFAHNVLAVIPEGSR